MRAPILPIATLAVALLSACGSPTVTAENASMKEVAQKLKESGIADEKFIEPGHWQMTMTINDMTMPGAPPGMAERMKGAIGKPRTFDSCVTAEEAKKPKEDFFAGEDSGNCRYAHFSMGNGKTSMEMHCSEGGVKRVVKMDGTYSGDAYRMNIKSSGEGGPDNPMAGMTMTATMDAKRTGVCTGKEPG
jgi:hypothetical protein